jgi:beta-lactamase class D
VNRLALTSCVLMLLAAPASATRPGFSPSLERLASWMTGRFSSAAQAARDTAFRDVRLVIVPVWRDRTDARWLYVEQAIAGREDRPYRQRVYRLMENEQGAFESAVFVLPGAERFAGAWREARPLAALSPDSLVERRGCSVFLYWKDGAYRGGTIGSACASDLRGAATATSEVVIESHRMVTLDRGFDAAGAQVWGSTRGGYEFAKQKAVAPASREDPGPRWVEEPGWARHFREAGVSGTLVLYDVGTGDWHVHDRARATRRFLPASTFKIPNSLIALETGVIRDERDTLRWDGVERRIAGWDRDQDMRAAIEHSTVWFYQELARRIGPDRMRQRLAAIGYGNRDIGGGIDRFWLDGRLRISAVEQIRFVDRLRRGDLPFSPRSIGIVHDILIRDRGDGWVLRAKTGWSARVQPQTGWYVGWIERDRRPYVFALNLEVRGEQDLAARAGIVNRILRERGLRD